MHCLLLRHYSIFRKIQNKSLVSEKNSLLCKNYEKINPSSEINTYLNKLPFYCRDSSVNISYENLAPECCGLDSQPLLSSLFRYQDWWVWRWFTLCSRKLSNMLTRTLKVKTNTLRNFVLYVWSDYTKFSKSYCISISFILHYILFWFSVSFSNSSITPISRLSFY